MHIILAIHNSSVAERLLLFAEYCSFLAVGHPFYKYKLSLYVSTK